MTKEKIKYYLDFVPLAILTITALCLIWTIATTNVMLLWKHYVGLIALVINFFLFWWQHKSGVIGLGVTLLAGLFSLLSFDYSITTTTLSLGQAGSRIPVFYGQPIFLLWFIIHFILSFRHYIGVLTKKYWEDVFNNLFNRLS